MSHSPASSSSSAKLPPTTFTHARIHIQRLAHTCKQTQNTHIKKHIECEKRRQKARLKIWGAMQCASASTEPPLSVPTSISAHMACVYISRLDGIVSEKPFQSPKKQPLYVPLKQISFVRSFQAGMPALLYGLCIIFVSVLIQQWL